MNWIQQIAAWIGKLRCWFVVDPWEQSIRIRLGNKMEAFGPGVHFQIPIVDRVCIQNSRLRVLNLPLQTVTTKDGQTVTLGAIVQWKMLNIMEMYYNLQAPEDWIYNTALAATSKAVSESSGKIEADDITTRANEALLWSKSYGIEVLGVSVSDLVRVRTYRLMGDQHGGWTWDRMGALQGGPR